MIGNVIQSKYLVVTDYPAAAALSFVLMALILIAVIVYIRFAGTEALMGEEAGRDGATARQSALRDDALGGCATRPQHLRGLAIAYMLIPIAVIAIFSFNDPDGPLQLHLAGLHPRPLGEPVRRSRSSPTRWSRASSWPRSRR